LYFAETVTSTDTWNKRITKIPYTSLCRKLPHMYKFLGLHQNNFNRGMQKYLTGTINRRHFLNTIGVCRPLACETNEAETASMSTIISG
jgi:hypothetical protein